MHDVKFELNANVSNGAGPCLDSTGLPERSGLPGRVPVVFEGFTVQGKNVFRILNSLEQDWLSNVFSKYIVFPLQSKDKKCWIFFQYPKTKKFFYILFQKMIFSIKINSLTFAKSSTFLQSLTGDCKKEDDFARVNILESDTKSPLRNFRLGEIHESHNKKISLPWINLNERSKSKVYLNWSLPVIFRGRIK